MKKIYIIAGEASGDLHASNLMKAILSIEKNVDFRYWGGDAMQSVAGKPVKHISDLAFMGFIEVLLNLKAILKNISFCKEDILSYKPDVLVLVDYPGFNIRIAQWAKKHNIPVVYYISPQIWAWKQNRVHILKKVVDKMLVILPFEKPFYEKFGMDVNYVGHPLLDAIDQFKNQNAGVDFRQKHNLKALPIVSMLPGSRKQEIVRMLPIMLESIDDLKGYQFIIAASAALPESFYNQFTANYKNVKIIYGSTYDILSISTAALVTSGTATLETALFNVPEVVCYRGSTISYEIAKRLVKIEYISLVNLILQKEAVKELIQRDCNPKNIKKELNKILLKDERYEEIKRNYSELIILLGDGGASENAAQEILEVILNQSII